MDSLKRDYKPSKSSKALLNEIRAQEELQLKEDKNKADEIQYQLRKHKTDKINNYLNDLNAEERNNLHLAFEQHLMNSKDIYVIKSYKKNGFRSRWVQDLFSVYIFDLIEENQLKRAI
jgi:hypothetical protein